VANGVVYIDSFDDNVYALNASTGAFLWKYTTPGCGGGCYSTPVVANGWVYVNFFDLYAFHM
jgi:serine/threonine-protein kinase